MENSKIELTCPFCNRVLLVRIEVPSQGPAPIVNANSTVDSMVNEVSSKLPQDAVLDLNVGLSENEPDKIRVTPKKFLCREKFLEVNEIIKELGGEYVSQGRHSYWRIPATER